MATDAMVNALLQIGQNVNNAYMSRLGGADQSAGSESTSTKTGAMSSAKPSISSGAYTRAAGVPTRNEMAVDNFSAGNTVFNDIQKEGMIGNQSNNVANVSNTRDLLKTPFYDMQRNPNWAVDLNPWQNNNFSKQSRYGNLNNKPYTNTLYLSRLADLLNNRRHWIPTQVGYSTNSKFGTQATKLGHSERWDPINTQEMRQMRANEAIDSAQRQQDVQLQAGINKYPFDVQKTVDTATQQLAAATGQDALTFKRSIEDAMTALAYTDPAKLSMNMIMQTYLSYLQKQVNVDVINTLLNYIDDDPLKTDIYMRAVMGTESPDRQQMVLSAINNDLAEMSNGDPLKYMQLRAAFEAAVAGTYSTAISTSYNKGFTNSDTSAPDIFRER